MPAYWFLVVWAALMTAGAVLVRTRALEVWLVNLILLGTTYILLAALIVWGK